MEIKQLVLLRYVLTLFVAAFMLISTETRAQSAIKDVEILKGVADYRTRLIESDQTRFQRMKAVTKFLEYHNLETRDIELFYEDLRNYLIMASKDDYLDEGINPYIMKALFKQKNVDGKVLTEEEFQVVLKELKTLRAYTDLMVMGLLSASAPFPIKPEGDFFQELKFFSFRHGEKIAEIGAGTGDFSFILESILKDEEIYLNEIGTRLPKLLNDKLNDLYQDKSPDIEIVKGDTLSSDLPKNYFDKVILRDALHHFDYKEAMLTDIYDILKPNGRLLVNENDASTVGKFIGASCKRAMKISEVKSVIEEQGFTLLDELTLGSQGLLIYEKINNRK